MDTTYQCTDVDYPKLCENIGLLRYVSVFPDDMLLQSQKLLASAKVTFRPRTVKFQMDTVRLLMSLCEKQTSRVTHMFLTNALFQYLLDTVNTYGDASLMSDSEVRTEIKEKLIQTGNALVSRDISPRDEIETFVTLRLMTVAKDLWDVLRDQWKRSPSRIIQRTQLVKEELIQATWHPSRHIDWCLDYEEALDLRESS